MREAVALAGGIALAVALGAGTLVVLVLYVAMHWCQIVHERGLQGRLWQQIFCYLGEHHWCYAMVRVDEDGPPEIWVHARHCLCCDAKQRYYRAIAGDHVIATWGEF